MMADREDTYHLVRTALGLVHTVTSNIYSLPSFFLEMRQVRPTQLGKNEYARTTVVTVQEVKLRKHYALTT